MATNKQLLLYFSALAGACLPAYAAEWTTRASVTPGITYTDNVCLSADNEQSEWIGLVTPAVTVEADGNRANFSIDGEVEANTLTDSKLEDLGCRGGSLGNRQQFAPRLNGSADAILVEKWFYIDATANIYQNQTTAFASGGGDSLDRAGNTNTTHSYAVSPYIERRFKDTAELNLRYTWDEQFNSSDLVRDSTEEKVNALVGSVPGTSKYSWGLQGDYSNVSYSNSRSEFENNQDSELSSAQLNLGYQLNRRWQVNGFYGEEWNDFVSISDEIDGNFWDIGLRWTPNARTTVDAGVGDRFFGNNPRFAIIHSHKRSEFNASYAKTLTYDRNIRALSSPDTGLPPGGDPGATTLSNSPILDERFTLGYSYQGRRTGFGVSAFQSEQTQSGNSQLGFQEGDFRGFTVSANRSLSQQTSLNAAVSWNEQEPKNSANDNGGNFFQKSETWDGSLGIARQLSQNTNLGLNYRYTDRQSDSVFNTYTENRVTLDLRVDF